MNVITKTLQLADGRTITIETGKVAKQTDGAVMLTMNNTVLRRIYQARRQSQRQRNPDITTGGPCAPPALPVKLSR